MKKEDLPRRSEGNRIFRLDGSARAETTENTEARRNLFGSSGVEEKRFTTKYTKHTPARLWRENDERKK